MGEHIRIRRLELGLLQREVATTLGVDATTIHNWKCNHRKPSFRYIRAIIGFLGYTPDLMEAGNLGEKIVLYRRLQGISQKGLARQLGVDPGTIGRWERNESQPCSKLNEKLFTLLCL